MTFDERLAQTQAKMDDLKAKINSSIESAKETQKLQKKDVLVKLAKMDDAIENFGKDVEAQIYCDVSSMKDEAKADVDAMNDELDKISDKIDSDAAKAGDALDKIDEKIDAQVNDSIDTIEGDVNAAEEDIRLAKERYESKLNSTRLKVQMHQEQAKAKIEAKKNAIDKAAMEELISDLLDYADDCQMIAYAYAMEAELAILDACDAMEEYDAKFGKAE